jgi:hypothetical protein
MRSDTFCLSLSSGLGVVVKENWAVGFLLGAGKLLNLVLPAREDKAPYPLLPDGSPVVDGFYP